MSKNIQDTSTIVELRKVVNTTQVVDGDGSVIGLFVPLKQHPHEPEISEEELDSREREDGYTLDEIMADLEKLA